jgi:hypothetical protein
LLNAVGIGVLAIAHSWVTAFDDAGLRVAGAQVCLRDQPSRCATHK